MKLFREVVSSRRTEWRRNVDVNKKLEMQSVEKKNLMWDTFSNNVKEEAG